MRFLAFASRQITFFCDLNHLAHWLWLRTMESCLIPVARRETVEAVLRPLKEKRPPIGGTGEEAGR